MNSPPKAGRAAVVCTLTFLAGCGASHSSAPPPSAASTATPAPSETPSAPVGSGTLVIAQLGVTMQIPAGLTAVTYGVDDPSHWSRQEPSGASVSPVAAFSLSTPEWDASLPASHVCDVAIAAGSPEAYLTVWNVDPGTLPAQDAPNPGATPHLGNRWFVVEGAGPAGGPGACANGQPYSLTPADTLENLQLPLLEQMVATLSAT